MIYVVYIADLLIIFNLVNVKIKDDNLKENQLESTLFLYGYPTKSILDIPPSRIIVNDKYWPDYKVQDFIKDVQQFNIRERRFGKTSDQVNS